MVYVNIIINIGRNIHELQNGVLKIKFSYIIGTSKQVKVAAWQKNWIQGMKYQRLVASYCHAKKLVNQVKVYERNKIRYQKQVQGGKYIKQKWYL